MQPNRSNIGGLLAGSLLILFGLLALAAQLFDGLDWGSLWPFAVIAAGGLFFAAMAAGGKQSAAFAIPGSIVGGIGLILLIQTITGRWESMSYFWTLIILFVGVGIYIMGRYGGDASQQAAGARVMKVGFILFVIFGTLFEMIFFSRGNLIFPILLIAAGAYLVLSRSGLFRGKKTDEPSDSSVPPAS